MQTRQFKKIELAKPKPGTAVCGPAATDPDAPPC